MSPALPVTPDEIATACLEAGRFDVICAPIPSDERDGSQMGPQ